MRINDLFPELSRQVKNPKHGALNFLRGLQIKVSVEGIKSCCSMTRMDFQNKQKEG